MQLLADFGFSKMKSENSIERLKTKCPDISPERLQEKLTRLDSFLEWFIPDERKVIIELIRDITWNIVSANSIYPTNETEYQNRRIFHNNSIIGLRRLEQELQMCIEILPVDINKYTPFAIDINSEISLIEAVKKSDKKRFRSLVSNNEIQTLSSKYFKIIKGITQLFKNEQNIEKFDE